MTLVLAPLLASDPGNASRLSKLEQAELYVACSVLHSTSVPLL